MPRISLALLGVSTTAFAALAFEVPSVTIPAPTMPQSRKVNIGGDGLSNPFRLPSPQHASFFDSGELPVNAILGLTELFGSEERDRTAIEATRVEVVRLSSAHPYAINPTDYIESEPVKLVGWQAEILQRTLTADSSYIWDTELTERPDCIPTFEVRIRLHQGSKMVIAELSLSSRMIRILEGKTFISEQPLTERGFGRLLFLEPNQP